MTDKEINLSQIPMNSIPKSLYSANNMEHSLNNPPHFNISVREFKPEDPPIRLCSKESPNESKKKT